MIHTWHVCVQLKNMHAVGATSERCRSDAGPMSERRRADVGPMSERRRSDVGAASARCRSDVGPTSGRRRPDVAPTSILHRRIAPLSLDRTAYIYMAYIRVRNALLCNYTRRMQGIVGLA